MHTLDVDNNGTRLSYIDSGAPAGDSYITIFAIHGLIFTSPIFQRVIALASQSGVRFVAIDRRGHRGSTPLSPEDHAIIADGTDAQKAALLQARGIECAKFIEKFITKNDLHPISADGKTGGVAILGWSLGCTVALAAISNINQLSSVTQSRLALYIRSLIMHEPPSVALGTPIAPQTWSPQLDVTIPPPQHFSATTQWLTAYFKHADISSHDPNTLTHILPATFRAPSIFTMSDEQISKIVDETQATADTQLILGFSAALLQNFRNACFSSHIRRLLPSLKITEIIGGNTLPFSFLALWSMQKEDAAHGGGFISYEHVNDVNHFMQWDEPEKALQVYIKVA